MTPLETRLYLTLLLLRDKSRLLGVAYGTIYLKLSEADISAVMSALDAYENAATVARLGEGADGQDERALETAKKLTNNK